MVSDKGRIRCSINNCHYWMDGNYCEASSIMITSDKIPSETYHGIDSSTIENVNTPVQMCQETCCKTFIQEGDKDEHKVDDVYKVGNHLDNQSGQGGPGGQGGNNSGGGSKYRM